MGCKLEMHDYNGITSAAPGGGRCITALDPFGQAADLEASVGFSMLRSTPATPAEDLRKAMQILDDQLPGKEVAAIALYLLISPNMATTGRRSGNILPLCDVSAQATGATRAGEVDIWKCFKGRGEQAYCRRVGQAFGLWIRITRIDLILSLRDWKFSRPLLESLSCKPRGADSILQSSCLEVCMERIGEKEGGKKLQDDSNEALGGNLVLRVYLARLLYRSRRTGSRTGSAGTHDR